MRGRKPKPTSLKRLQGTYRADRANPNEPQFGVPQRMPSPPDYLSDEAADIWRELGRMLLEAGLFTKIDKFALGMFCAAAARWMDAERKVQKSGPVLISEKTGQPYTNPFLHVANRAWDQMKQMFGEFGLTPAERARMKIEQPDYEPSLAEQLFSVVDAD